MLNYKSKYLTWILCLIVGMSYVSAMSNVDIHYFWKGLIIFLPIQLVALIYATAKIWRVGGRNRGENSVTTD
ncbi:hypothetical protein CLI64_14425 [Nostoc sp. CENA543]|nr:hypothetical protein CLI64_14425 [Nostoc sp. CENA543]